MEQNREITHEQWNSEYENIQKENNYVVYISGSIGEDGINWCSDCVETKDAVAKIAENAKTLNIPFITVRAGLREGWKNPQNALRVHKQVKANDIPTVILFQKGQALKKIQYIELQNQEIVDEFLEDL